MDPGCGFFVYHRSRSIVFRSRPLRKRKYPGRLGIRKSRAAAQLLSVRVPGCCNIRGNLGGIIPFYEIMPESFLIFGLILATMATIIASQALISGTFTLVNEAMKLKLWPATRVRYPSQMKGQIYIPAINWILMLGCILVVFIFQESTRMEGAYGLAITFDMMMTSSLLVFYFAVSKKSTVQSHWNGVSCSSPLKGLSLFPTSANSAMADGSRLPLPRCSF